MYHLLSCRLAMAGAMLLALVRCTLTGVGELYGIGVAWDLVVSAPSTLPLTPHSPYFKKNPHRRWRAASPVSLKE